MSPVRATTEPRTPHTSHVSKPNRSTQRKPTTQHKRPTQMTIRDFITRPILQALPTTDNVMPPPASSPSQESLQSTDLAQTPPTQLPVIEPRPRSLQRTLQNIKTNEPWGDATNYQKPHGHFRVLSKNIGTLNTQHPS